MTDAKRIADKYISRTGGLPAQHCEFVDDQFIDDLMTAGDFILFHDAKDAHALVYPRQAFDALCRLARVDPRRIEAILKPRT